MARTNPSSISASTVPNRRRSSSLRILNAMSNCGGGTRAGRRRLSGSGGNGIRALFGRLDLFLGRLLIGNLYTKHQLYCIVLMFFWGGITNDFNRAVSCSGDQSIKFWDTTQDPSTLTSSSSSSVSKLHANEPFTSFVFCGGSCNDESGLTIIASLSYSLRIYKMRTLSLLHTISLNELKLKYIYSTNINLSLLLIGNWL
jgi:WD40 repeat protein